MDTDRRGEPPRRRSNEQPSVAQRHASTAQEPTGDAPNAAMPNVYAEPHYVEFPKVICVLGHGYRRRDIAAIGLHGLRPSDQARED